MSHHVICPSSPRNPLGASVQWGRQSTQAGQGQQHLGHTGWTLEPEGSRVEHVL